ncbi:MAG TPA: iron-sulfur cluster assembly scaffold protein [Chloroflexota bacterium]|nr:iron-sulfur cluster assembly scaffold protein [Chloroflexota bacterium]
MDEKAMEDTAAVSSGSYLGGRAGIPGQGPFMAIVLKVEDGRIVEASFQTYGCPSAVACGRYVTDWLDGKTLAEAEDLDAGEVERGVGALPLGKEHTVQLTIDALRNALAGDSGRMKDEG